MGLLSRRQFKPQPPDLSARRDPEGVTGFGDQILKSAKPLDTSAAAVAVVPGLVHGRAPAHTTSHVHVPRGTFRPCGTDYPRQANQDQHAQQHAGGAEQPGHGTHALNSRLSLGFVDGEHAEFAGGPDRDDGQAAD